MEKFEVLARVDQENIVMPRIIETLRKLGGRSDRNELSKEVVSNSEEIPEEYVKTIKTSRNGNDYLPFRYTFNFAIKNLIFAEFIIIPMRGTVELTEKGRTIDLSTFNAVQDVRKLADPKWKDQSRKNKDKRNKHKKGIPTIMQTVEEIDNDSQVDEWRNQLAVALLNFTPGKFELFARALIKNMGVAIDEKVGVKLTGDGGLDGYGYLTTDDFRTARVAIQAKRWSGLVSSPEIDKFRGAMDKYNAEYGVFIATSDFTRDAIQASRVGTRVITLINGDKIADLVAKFELHVQPVTTYVLDDYYEGSE
ncbi:restriction endonuclease [Paucilactobacillus hokkaidonensis JCM 18461]|uniref:Restriction endonuclease n=3 Tax=Paucilactobacillus hokkaidonensis TaxID=1193095 RepID=A0A0A1GWF0_9LACO|nr:restriction endonuclease [Paucilactobacillus hokkaidonensis]KRO09510.1 mrr restriction system protein [Paucilactobacillus hokkaidonensis]BAP84686.1 restriction endonuclease [Paucilactobacillus hokkaidonensis JCM 18461]